MKYWVICAAGLYYCSPAVSSGMICLNHLIFEAVRFASKDDAKKVCDRLKSEIGFESKPCEVTIECKNN